MQEIVNLIVNNGVSVIIVAYFIYKDFKTSNEQLQATKEQTASNQKLIDKIEQLISIMAGGENDVRKE
jgi:hypothetical protein